MFANSQPPRIDLPKGWQGCVKSAVLHAIALAHYAIVYARAWAADSINARVRLAAENDRLHEACALLREELRIKDRRMTQIAPQRRPHYGPHERMAILELRAARGWSLKQTADTFFVTPATVTSWTKRIDEKGPDALLQLREPVNKFPDFVRYIVQRLKTLSPSMGKVKIAETLCRAGLHLGVTTVGRILKEAPQSAPGVPAPCTGVVTAERPNHVWHVDLTAVPTSVGFWVPWLPFALPQCWPFCWWVAVVIDHYSRRIMGVAAFKNSPTSRSIQHFLERAMDTFHQELTCFANWYNHSRPHSSLDGKTPDEVYHNSVPACERPRYEPRARWPHSAPCASPHAPVAGQCGTPIRLDVRYHSGRKHLPIVALRRAA
jgi:transcriptional regulator with XRE-family HTH domain